MQQSTAQQLSIWQGVLNMTGVVYSLIVVRGVPTSSLAWPQGVTFVVGAAIVIAAKRLAARWSDDVCAAAFVVGIAPVVPLAWGMASYRVQQGHPWCAFEVYQLSCLTVATLAPPRLWAGVFGIALFVLTPFAQFAQFHPSQRICIAGGSLEGVIAFGLFATVLLVFRVRSRRIATASVRAFEEARMMKRLSRAVAAIRDLANSPLQALTIEAEVLRRKHPEVREHAERIARTTKRLNRLNSLIGEHTPNLVSESGDTSFDASEILRSLDEHKRT